MTSLLVITPLLLQLIVPNLLMDHLGKTCSKAILLLNNEKSTFFLKTFFFSLKHIAFAVSNQK